MQRNNKLSLEEIEAGYNPEKYKNKEIIILGVHSHRHDIINISEDREYYYLSKYIKEKVNDVVVCATSSPSAFENWGYKGFEYIKSHFGDIKYIGGSVWYPAGYIGGKGKRIPASEAKRQLHKVLQDKFPGKQVILLRLGTPYIADTLVEGLLREDNANERYLVIDDKRAEIYKFMDRAKKALGCPENVDKRITCGPRLDNIENITDEIPSNIITYIMSVNERYNLHADRYGTMFYRILSKLQNVYGENLLIFISSYKDGDKLKTLGELIKLCEDYRKIHFSMAVYPHKPTLFRQKL